MVFYLEDSKDDARGNAKEKPPPKERRLKVLRPCQTTRKAGLQKAFSDYEAALKSCGEWKAGFYSFKSSDTLKAAIDELLKFAERK